MMSRSTISQPVPTSSTRWNDSPIPKPGIKHIHKDLWFEDGSIVLQAENVIYRVYRGHPIRQSVVFIDMLAALQTPRAQTSQSAKDSPSQHDHEESISATDNRETLSILAVAGVDDHDVPADVVVDLILSDTAFDTTNFLKALFDPCYFAELESRGLDEIASILRLSTKYQVGATRSRVISILNKTFPTTLVNQRITEKSKSQPTLRQLFILANICREAEANILLPSIYYALCKFHLSRLFVKSSNNVALDPVNLQAIILGRQELQTLARRSPYSYLSCQNSTLALCQTSQKCRENLQTRALAINNMNSQTFLDPLCPVIYRNLALCGACQIYTKGLVDEASKKIWDKLPMVFGLPGWQNLKVGCQIPDEIL